MKEAHHLLDHHHDEVLHCESDEAHIHSEEYAHVDCLLCFFYFVPGEFNEVEFSLQQLPITERLHSFSYKKILQHQYRWHYFLRGPPDVVA